MKILIGYDGSEYARAAVEDLARAGLGEAVEAEVLSAADVWVPPAGMEGVETGPIPVSLAVERARAQASAALAAAQQTAQDGRAQIISMFPAWNVAATAVADSPAWAVIKRASEWSANLAVVGSHGHGSISRLLLGSVSQKILVEAPCSVRIGRKSNRAAERGVRLLIGLDGSADSGLAVQAAASRRWPSGSEARLLTAVDLKIATAMLASGHSRSKWISDEDQTAEDWVGRMLEVMGDKLRTVGLAVSTTHRAGDPKELLLAEAETWGADAIFLGARGHSLVERIIVGSVAASVAARAHCSVEIVRPGSAETTN